MTELLTAAQMRAIEQAAIESGQVTGLELMERAGQGVVDAIFEEWPELKRGPAPAPPGYLEPDEGDSLRAVVLCGPGNNGGDGFVVARLLREMGWEVEVFLYGDPGKLPPDARVNYGRWLGPTIDAKEISTGGIKHPDVAIDALFGTGLTRAIENAALWEHLWAHNDATNAWETHPHGSSYEITPPKTVAVDLPSGLCSDSGVILGGELPEHGLRCAGSMLTVTFHSKKLGYLLAEGPEHCGKVVVADIGLSSIGDLHTKSRDALLTHHSEKKLGRVLCHQLGDTPRPYLQKEQFEHKYTHGHALVLSGGAGKTGAARLAARGALRIGAGLVTIGVPAAAQMEVAEQVTAIMLQRVEGGDGLSDVLKDKRMNALCLGPGLGLDRAGDLVPVVLAAGRSTVLDADALTAFAENPSTLFAMLYEDCVLTPHGGEFARLFPDIAEKLNSVPTRGPAYSKVDATREAAARAGCVVLFKGPDTVIAAPDGRCSINSAHYERAAPWLATAGSGDVLAGFITGLLARGFEPMQAAEEAAWLHVECARNFGPGLIAEDLPEQLPDVLKQLNL